MNEMNVKADAETKALIAELWQRHLPTTRERLAALDRIAAKAALEPLSDAEREEGVAISHKFAGYTRGTELAMQLEKLFRSLPPPQPDVITPLTAELRESIFPTNS